MPAGHRVDGLGGERGRHQALTRREAIVPPEAEMHAQGSGAVGPDEAPEVALVFIVRELAGTPAVHAPGTLDLTGDDVAAEVGGEHAHTRELPCMSCRIRQGNVAAE